METLLSQAEFFGLSRQRQKQQFEAMQAQIAELRHQRGEIEALKARLAEIEPLWHQHEAKLAGRKLTRQIRGEETDPVQRARRLITARDEGQLVAKPNWEELSALMAEQGEARVTPEAPELMAERVARMSDVELEAALRVELGHHEGLLAKMGYGASLGSGLGLLPMSGLSGVKKPVGAFNPALTRQARREQERTERRAAEKQNNRASS